MDMTKGLDIRYKVFCEEQHVSYDLEVNMEEEVVAHNYLIMKNDTYAYILEF